MEHFLKAQINQYLHLRMEIYVHHGINGYCFKTPMLLYLGLQISLSKAKMQKVEMIEKSYFDDNIVQILPIS